MQTGSDSEAMVRGKWTREMSADKENVQWKDYALCQHFPPDMWFEEYVADVRTAKVVDEICASCPVRKLCLQAGVEGGEYGVWGGLFLINGRPDPQKNEHKTPEQTKALRDGIV